MINKVTLIVIIGLLFISQINVGQANANQLAQVDNASQQLIEKRKRALALAKQDRAEQPYYRQLVAKPVQLSDKNGLVYLGLAIPHADLVPFLQQLKQQLPKQFKQYRNNQIKRDGLSFHLTLINPFEYQRIDKTKINLSQNIQVNLHGLGTASNDSNTAYYVVASSTQGQFLRQQLLLKPKDFHVTLGFEPGDVYDRRKGVDTLIK